MDANHFFDIFFHYNQVLDNPKDWDTLHNQSKTNHNKDYSSRFLNAEFYVHIQVLSIIVYHAIV